EHIKNASIFKGTSKEIQNDLLDCILEVCHEEIIKQINTASYLAIIADETTDISGKTQLLPTTPNCVMVYMGKPHQGVKPAKLPTLTIIPPDPELDLAMYCIPNKVPITQP
ncbi:unnamed protein product, partial [Acanthoscelides obtectus]